MDRLKDFFDACRQGDPGFVKSLVARGIDPRSQHDFALVVAADRGNTELLRILVAEYGLAVDAWDGAALHHAAASGQMAAVRFLLERGSDVESRDNRALRWAVLRGHADVVSLLLDQGADRQVLTAEDLTSACGNGHLQLVEYLMGEVGLASDDDNLLRHAVIEGHHEIVRYLAHNEKADIRANDSYPLRHAARVGNLRMLETAVALGADAHAKTDEAFRSAVKGGHLECVEFLVERCGVAVHVLTDEEIAGVADKAVKAYLQTRAEGKGRRS